MKPFSEKGSMHETFFWLAYIPIACENNAAGNAILIAAESAARSACESKLQEMLRARIAAEIVVGNAAGNAARSVKHKL